MMHFIKTQVILYIINREFIIPWIGNAVTEITSTDAPFLHCFNLSTTTGLKTKL